MGWSECCGVNGCYARRLMTGQVLVRTHMRQRSKGQPTTKGSAEERRRSEVERQVKERWSGDVDGDEPSDR